MPACDSVNARNAPTANKGIRLLVIPSKAINSTADRTAMTMMPSV